MKRKSVFNKYVLTEGTTEVGASAIAGLSIGYRSGSQVLLKQWKLVDTLKLQESGILSDLAAIPCCYCCTQWPEI